MTGARSGLVHALIYLRNEIHAQHPDLRRIPRHHTAKRRRAMEKVEALSRVEKIIDDAWREHLHDMDYLREGIHLRGFAQIEPIVAYKNEAFDLFNQLIGAIWTQFAQLIFNVQVQVEQPIPAPQPTRIAGSPSKPARVTYESGGSEGLSALAAAAAGIDPIAAAAAASAPGPVDESQALNREQRRQLEREKKKQAKRGS